MADSKQSEEKRTVHAVQISCDLVDALRELDGAGVTELANHIGISKSAAHTHLATLKENELVVKSEGQYKLSLQFLDFGKYVQNQIEIYDIVEAEIDRLAAETGEVAQFMVEEHGRGVYLHKARGENAIQTSSYIGNRNNLHCTALGKAIISQYDTERIDEIIEQHGLPKQTPNTITDRDGLLEELEQVRADGIAYDREEILPGLRCIAAPVVRHDNELLGAISVTGPISRMGSERLNGELADNVRHSANVIAVNATQIQ